MLAPCAYFDKVIEDHKFKLVRVVTEADMKHPCIQAMQERHPDVTFQIQSKSVEEDACALMNAKNLAIGSWSTFAEVLELLNERVVNIFQPGSDPNKYKPGRCARIVDGHIARA